MRRDDPHLRPLYLMTKPWEEALARISALPRTARNRKAELAHVTLLAFRDLATESPDFVVRVRSLLDDFRADAFPLSFDRIEERDVVALRTGATAAARAFQRRLTGFLAGRGFDMFGPSPTAHLTINYSGDCRGREPIEPIGWTVDEVLLIESVHGEARHVMHGRWRLARQLLML